MLPQIGELLIIESPGVPLGNSMKSEQLQIYSRFTEVKKTAPFLGAKLGLKGGTE